MECAQDHFTKLAHAYNLLRTTDAEPVLRIRDILGQGPCVAADIGCGAGRYCELLLDIIPDLTLWCVDANAAMLDECRVLLRPGHEGRFQCAQADAGRFGAATGRGLDGVLCFNAVHHFHLAEFLAEARSALKPGGPLFIYTRTRSQNARSVWGLHFPFFAERETRLYETAELRDEAERMGFQVLSSEEFVFQREASLERLIFLARSRHYSTFAVYKKEELAEAISAFEALVRGSEQNLEHISWLDRNLLVILTKRAGFQRRS